MNRGNDDIFDVKKQKNFLITQGWSYTGKPPHVWSDPTKPYDESQMLPIEKAVEVARERLQMLRTTASEEVLPDSTILQVLERVENAYITAGCGAEAGELFAIERVRKTFKEEMRMRKRRVGL